MIRTTFLALAILGSVFAQDAEFDPTNTQVPKPGDRQIRVAVEYFEVSALDALKLQSDQKLAAKDALLREELIKRIEGGSVNLLANATLSCRSGETATIENVAETIYPTEFEASTMPDQVTLDQGSGDALVSPPKPMSFQTRNVGLTLEVEATFRDEMSNKIDLRFAPELVFRAGDRMISEWKTDRGDSSIKIPLFYSLRMNTSLGLESGKPYLAGVLTPKDDEGNLSSDKRVFLFVTASARTVGDP